MRAILISVFLMIPPLLAIAADEEAQYAAVDRHALAAPASATESVAALSSYLTEPFETDEKKARAIFRWIADNIAYDVEGLFSGHPAQKEAGDVLQSRSSVCAGYASLFEALGREAGLEVVSISGYAKGYGYHVGDIIPDKSNHAWNAVKIDGEWKLMDPTWGAGNLNKANHYQKEFEPFYFFTKPEEFIYEHFPTEARWQLLPEPVSQEEFQDLPYVSPAFFQCGLELADAQPNVIDVSGEYMLEFSASSGTLCTANLKRGGKKLESAVFVQRSGSTFQVRVRPPGAGEYVLEIFAKQGAPKKTYAHAASFKVETADDPVKSGPFPTTFGTFDETGAQLRSPLNKELPSGSTQFFSLTAPGAKKVALISGEEWDYLKKDGDRFEGIVEVSAGTMTVSARYPKKDTYQALIEYTGTGDFKRAPAPVKYKRFMDSGAELLAPLTKELPAGTTQAFRIKLPGAIKAAAIRGKQWQYLKKNGDYFEGDIKIGKGENTIYGKYKNETSFDGLLEYEGK